MKIAENKTFFDFCLENFGALPLTVTLAQAGVQVSPPSKVDSRFRENDRGAVIFILRVSQSDMNDCQDAKHEEPWQRTQIAVYRAHNFI